MVCLGNICRSPLAEGIMKQKIAKYGLDWTVCSAGTNGYHTNEPPHRLSQKVATMNGVDISCQRARQFRSADFEEYDIIYAMASDVIDNMRQIAGSKFNGSKVDLLMNVLHPGKNLDIPDPWYGTEPGYHEVYRMIDAACEELFKKAQRHRGAEAQRNSQ